MGILGNIFSKRPSASPDSITFDASRYSFQGDSDGTRVWYLPEGGGIGLYYFALPPNLPSQLPTINHLKDFYVSQMGEQLQCVECRVVGLDGVQSVWVIAKGKDEQTGGAVYIGSLTLPFRDFSFVIKIQCHEGNTTGVREALLVEKAFRDGTATMENDKLVMHGWSPDDEKFDSLIPQHPISRLRAEMRSIAASIRIDQTVKEQPRFPLPMENN